MKYRISKDPMTRPRIKFSERWFLKQPDLHEAPDFLPALNKSYQRHAVLRNLGFTVHSNVENKKKKRGGGGTFLFILFQSKLCHSLFRKYVLRRADRRRNHRKRGKSPVSRGSAPRKAE
jgi:hypothetical protein